MAPAWRKPLIDPARFLGNQLRKRLRFIAPAGGERQVMAFHMPAFHVVNGEAVSEEIAGYGVYEPKLTEAFLLLVKPGDVVVDVGMHLGYYTTLFASLAGPAGEVHAFEPTPSTRELASGNVGRFANVRVHPFALWSSPRQMKFHDYGLRWMAFNSFTDAKLEGGPVKTNEIEVSCTTLDEFRRGLARPVKVMKIDAESAELDIIQGGRDMLMGDRPVVSMEVGDTGSGTRSGAVIDAMVALDYRPWEYNDGGFRPHERRASYSYDNLIFAHKSVPALPA